MKDPMIGSSRLGNPLTGKQVNKRSKK